MPMPAASRVVKKSKTHDQRSDHRTWIYFLSNENQTKLRIGKSKQPRGQRKKQHENGAFEKTSTIELCEVKGHASDESAIHRYFAKYQVEGKTDAFFATPELIEYIHWLRDQWFVAMPDASNKDRDDLPLMESSAWLPRPDRRKPISRRQSPRQVQLPGLETSAISGEPFGFGAREVTIDDFYTSEVIIEAVRRTMGRIDLDPASHAIANKVIQAHRFFTKADNGLNREWSGTVWLNPPFSSWGDWSPKVASEWSSGRIPEMCVLAATRTITARYFRPIKLASRAMCIFDGRIKFWGGLASTPDDGHVVFYFGQNVDRFRTEFKELGDTYINP